LVFSYNFSGGKDKNNATIIESVVVKNENASDVEAEHNTKTEESIFNVKKVVDGDTIVVLDSMGEEFKVRLIGVNTPETVDPRKKVECFGKEASIFLKNMLDKKTVKMSVDLSQGLKDKYGRLLRYVYVDNILVNKKIIEDGYGYEYTYKTPYQFQKEFKSAQTFAKENKLGLWADGVCERKDL
jgi:micrococcal nuclease